MNGEVVTIFVICTATAYGLTKVPENLSQCCTSISGTCLEICNQINLENVESENGKYNIELLYRECQHRKSKFWRCVNSTLLEMTRRWQSRPCCSLPHASKCRLSCLQSKSRADIRQECRVTDEISFFKCLDHHDGEECCRNARTRDCYRQCRDTIHSQTQRKASEERDSQLRPFIEPLPRDAPPTFLPILGDEEKPKHYLKYNNYPGQNARYLQSCKIRSPLVLSCLRRYSLSQANKTHPDIHCCKNSDNVECQRACKKALSTYTDDQEIIEDLANSPCGPPFPGNQMWQCFLAQSEPHVKKSKNAHVQQQALVLDNAKLLCCHKARTVTCQDLCIKTFSTDWNQNWETFQKLCQYNHQEVKMLRCLSDVGEPCQHGCSNLSYCSNFNANSVALFRSCNAQSDMAAQKDVYFWQKQRMIRMPNINIPILDVRMCKLESWKAVACILHIKPCQRRVHSNFICRSDCLELMRSCVDNNRISFGHSPESLCHLISPADGAPCIPLKLYTNKKDERFGFKQMLNHRKLYPCNRSNCSNNEVCVVNTDVNPQDVRSLPYSCVPGCSLGEMSPLKVIAGSIVRVPLLPYRQGCHQLCECSKKGRLGKCRNLPCVKQKSCWYRGKLLRHQFQFAQSCNICSCHSGKIICSKTKCPVHGRHQLTKTDKVGMSCNCPDVYSPVCGRNGKTFPNSCIAQCCFGISLNSLEFGACFSVNPCYLKNPCKGHLQKCIPRQRSCLINEFCPQYECVTQKKSGKYVISKALAEKSVCDREGKDHVNIYEMLQKNQRISYWNKCQSMCDSSSGTVCGVDGETYTSQCSAKANYVYIDYLGRCKDFGPLTSFSTHRCSTVQCLSHKVNIGCKLVIPPGACCPICASVFRLFLNKRELENVQKTLKPPTHIIVQSIIERLRLQIKVLGCNVYGQLDIYGDVIIIIKAEENHVPQHYKICQAEADRLSSNLGPKSPLYMVDGMLSTIEFSLRVDMVTTSRSAAAYANREPVKMACLVLVTFLLYYEI